MYSPIIALIPILTLGLTSNAYTHVGLHCTTTALSINPPPKLSDCNTLLTPTVFNAAFVTTNTCSYLNAFTFPPVLGTAMRVACYGTCCVYTAGTTAYVPTAATVRTEALSIIPCGNPTADTVRGLVTKVDHGTCITDSSATSCAACFGTIDFTKREEVEERAEMEERGPSATFGRALLDKDRPAEE